MWEILFFEMNYIKCGKLASSLRRYRMDFSFLQNLKTAPVNWMQTLRVECEWELESWEVEIRRRGVTSDCLPYCTVFAPPPLRQRSLHRRARVPKHLPPPSASSHVAPLGRLEGCEKNGWGGGGRKEEKERDRANRERTHCGAPC